MAANDTIDMIRRIIADDTADLRERVQHLEHKTKTRQEKIEEHVVDLVIDDLEDDNETLKLAAGAEADHADELQVRLDQIKELHRLDAQPCQWTRANDGRMVAAPEGLWEISCLACNHKTMHQEGSNRPLPHCNTWLLASGLPATQR